MDENNNDNNVEYIESNNESTKEINTVALQRVQESDEEPKKQSNALDIFKKIGKAIVRYILIILLAIYHYIKDVVMFYINNDQAIANIYNYPMKKHIGYLLAGGLITSLIPFTIGWKLILTYSQFFKGFKLYPPLFKLTLTCFVVAELGQFILAMILKLIELIANHHNINYNDAIRVLNIQSITMNPFILVSCLLFFFGYQHTAVVVIALFLLIDGLFLSYLLMAKVIRQYRIVENDRLLFLIPMTISYSIVFILSGLIVYEVGRNFIISLLEIIFF